MLAKELGYEISPQEMEHARQKFVASNLVIDGVQYQPNPVQLQRLQIRQSIHALLARIAKPSESEATH